MQESSLTSVCANKLGVNPIKLQNIVILQKKTTFCNKLDCFPIAKLLSYVINALHYKIFCKFYIIGS